MTQSSLQTQCPNCQTRFRVTEEQLGIAKGKVRCGNCMKVFNAIEHQVVPGGNKSPSSPETVEPGETPSSGTPGSGVSEEDFVFADNPEEDAAEGRYAGTKLTFSDDELSDSFRSFDERDETDYKDAETDTTDENIDESWAEAILEDDEPAPRKPSEPARPDPSPESEPEPASDPELRPEPEFEPSLEEEPVFEQTETPASTGVRQDRDTDPFDDFVDESGFGFDEPDRPADSFHADPPFRDLRRDPVAVNSGRGGVRTMVWSIIVLALIGVLIAQVTWFQFDRLSAIPELRPFYEKGCALAGCELQPLINVEAIQSRKLVVRTDPDNRSQLVVDAVIINRADFEQPFPAIALTFSNLNGDVVAQSLFTPKEYLAGEGRELDAMPTDTPVRIAINIRDPGRDAVNYNILFRPYAP
ncbi:DUF3426 domain-containing protein [Marinobacter sp. BW6]|uniref:DUF3426 domain-containing protein n=1 Tax=Marinobacter sp. BW6 TaxID=2592624 RepID=UPI0011DE800E|nr:DUF3426 domain-containing protein [Marinobacter sp. BW6]TYC57244.1 DUF3426 domain-containing protein [Marinobacter sp. BW6]